MTFSRVFWILTLCLGACSVRGPAQTSEDQKLLALSLPSKSWEVQVDARGLTIKINDARKENIRYLLAENAATGVNVSVRLEQVSGGATAENCRDVFRARTHDPNLRVVNVEESRVGEMAILQFLIPAVGGASVQQENLFGCLAKEDVYVDIHLSKVDFKPADQQLFAEMLGRVRIADLRSSGENGSSMDYFKEGSRYYIAGQYEKAIGPYQKALDLEMKDRRLDNKWWHVLIDNLGIAYGITGDLKSAEGVIAYGISKDSTYPLFYYNMACVYAERDDLDNTIKYLKAAFSYKQNMLPGEEMPEPRKDDSFQRFLDNEKFRNALDSLNQRN